MRGGIVRLLIRTLVAIVVLLLVAAGVLVSGITRGPKVTGEMTFAGLSQRVEVSQHRLAVLPGLTHYDINISPTLSQTVIPFLDGA